MSASDLILSVDGSQSTSVGPSSSTAGVSSSTAGVSSSTAGPNSSTAGPNSSTAGNDSGFVEIFESTFPTAAFMGATNEETLEIFMNEMTPPPPTLVPLSGSSSEHLNPPASSASAVLTELVQLDENGTF